MIATVYVWAIFYSTAPSDGLPEADTRELMPLPACVELAQAEAMRPEFEARWSCETFVKQEEK